MFKAICHLTFTLFYPIPRGRPSRRDVAATLAGRRRAGLCSSRSDMFALWIRQTWRHRDTSLRDAWDPENRMKLYGQVRNEGSTLK